MRARAKKRKNFLPTLLVALFFWIAWGLILFKIPPGGFLVFFAFYFSLFAAIFLTSALLLANSRRGLMISLVLIGILILRQLGLANILNTILLFSSLISLEVYFSKRR